MFTPFCMYSANRDGLDGKRRRQLGGNVSAKSEWKTLSKREEGRGQGESKWKRGRAEGGEADIRWAGEERR
jgi:hypothetical protein